jgi:MoaA/NifB/PqqE/SkfB family radical SAM enzyme
LSFTIMNRNLDHLRLVYDLSRREGVQLARDLVQNSTIYFQKSDNSFLSTLEVGAALRYVMTRELRSWSPKRWARAYYDHGLLRFAERRERLLPSGAGFDSLFLDPRGIVYASNLLSLEMGDMARASLDEIWKGPQARSVRERIHRDGLTEDWIVCTIRGEMRRRWPQIGCWILARQVRYLVDRIRGAPDPSDRAPIPPDSF